MKKAIWNILAGISGAIFLLSVCCIDSDGRIGKIIMLISIISLIFTALSLYMLKLMSERELRDRQIKKNRQKNNTPYFDESGVIL